MIKTIIISVFAIPLFLTKNKSCHITKNNIGQILQYGLDQKIFSFNCTKYSDTLTFFIDNNSDSTIKEGTMVLLDNRKIAVYKKKQSNRSSLRLKQPILVSNIYELDFIFDCAGSRTEGFLKINCFKDTLNIIDKSYFTRIE